MLLTPLREFMTEELPVRDPRQNHDFTQEDSVTGGQSQSPLKLLTTSMNRRKYCNIACPFADACPMLPLSMAETVMVGTNKKHLCKLRDAPEAVKRRIKNMFMNGEEGLLSEIRTSLFVTSTNLGNDNKERLQYTDTLMKFHSKLYGSEGTFIKSPEPIEITVRQLTRDGAQEIKLSKTTERQIIRQDNAFKLLHRNDAPPDDPESLINSKKLDQILEGEHMISYDMSSSDSEE
jgi:hypothetical protein